MLSNASFFLVPTPFDSNVIGGFPLGVRRGWCASSEGFVTDGFAPTMSRDLKWDIRSGMGRKLGVQWIWRENS